MALTRKYLKAMGLEDDKIDQIIEAHTEVTTAIKADADRYKADAEKLSEVQAELDSLKAMKDDGLQAKVDQLTAELTEEKAGRKKDRQEATIRQELTAMGAQDVDYLLYKLGDTSELFDEDGQLKDKDAFAEKTKADYPNQFKAEPTKSKGSPPPPAGDRGEPHATSLREAILQQMNQNK